MVTTRRTLPPFTIVKTSDASTAGLKKLRVYVLVAPNHADQTHAIALQVTKDHIEQAGEHHRNDIVVTFVYTDQGRIGRAAADAVAIYVRDGVPEDQRPLQLASLHDRSTVRTHDGVITTANTAERHRPEPSEDA